MSFFLLSLIIVSLLALFESVTLFAFRRDVLRSGWSRWLYRIPFILGIAILLLVGVSFAVRRSPSFPQEFRQVVGVISALWYLPKLPIFLFLVLRGAWSLGVGLWRRLRSWGTPPAAVEVSPIASRNEQEQCHDRQRRELLRAAGWSLAAVPYSVVGFGMLKTVYDFEVVQVEMPLKGLPRALDGLRILQVSDVHAGSFYRSSPVEEARRLIMEQKADAIVVTGDWVNRFSDELGVIYGEFSKLRAPLGVYGSLGNHDHYSSPRDHAAIVSGIRSMGVDLLVNDNRRIAVDGAVLQIAGTDNTGLQQNFADIPRALRGLNSDDPIILLAHDPTFWDKSIREKTPVDLMLSGHTHGGQVGVHLLGDMYSMAQVVYKQWAGLYTDGATGQQLYINRGLGTTGVPLRVAVLPEITVFTLRSA